MTNIIKQVPKGTLALCTGAVLSLSLTQAKAEENSSPYLSDWLTQNINVIDSQRTRFGPQPVDSMYLEYEFMGRKGPWDLYGYIDIPNFFDVGNSAAEGIWHHGSPLFWELEPRLSIDHLVGHKLGFGPFKEFYIAADDIYDMGHNRDARQHTLYIGLGTDIDTHSKALLSFNLYARRQFENYRATNENSWDGYRAQIKYIYPITDLWGGHLTWIGFSNYNFGSDLGKDSPGVRTGTSLESTNLLNLSYTHWAFSTVARYWHNGGHYRNNAALNFGDGDFRAKSNGWGYYLIVGYHF